ncbi:hypothetical protein MMMDOFMJ_3931 [Methylobacterium gnaphalii]|nr:hypothetical protein MMMDOFMJ_3931 [Methylobacterium gnaphalii]
MRLVVDLDDLDLHRRADLYDLGRVVYAAPRHVGDVQQTVDAAEIDERAVLGDVLDDAIDDLTLFEVGHQLATLLGAALFEHGPARDDDVAAATIHLEDLEGLRRAEQWGHIAHRADVDLGARQEGHGAVEVDGVATLDLVEDRTGDTLVGLERLLELDPALLAASLVARDHGFAERVLDAVDIDLDNVADLQLAFAAGALEFLEGDATLRLGADIDDGDILLDADDGALDDRAFGDLVLEEALFEQRGEIVTARRGIARVQTCRHSLS